MSESMPWWGLCLLVITLLSQGVFLFTDARKRNANRWFWGLIGLMQFPWPTIFYFIFIRKIFHNNSGDGAGR